MIKIFSPTKKDMPGINKVFYKTWLETYPNEKVGITREDIEDKFKDSFSAKSLGEKWEKMKNTPGSQTFIAKENKDILGVIRIMARPERNQLQAIYVLPEHQGRGIGRMLWEEAVKHFDKNKRTIVECADYNDKAINFYKKLGFEDTGKRWKDKKRIMKSGAVIPEMEMELKK